MAQTIAAAASLALTVKLKKIFEAEDRFLAFPVGLGFSYRALEFMRDPGQTSLTAQEHLNFRGDFSRQLNLIPEDQPMFQPDASRFLWDAVRGILRESVFAESALSPAEEAELVDAIDLLTDDQVTEDGTIVPVNSPKVSRYYELKTLYDEAQQAYLDEELSVRFAEGPDAQRLKQQWDAYREKQLRDVRDKALRDWVDLGHKQEVEHAQARKNALEVRKYLQTYRQAYLAEMDLCESPDLAALGLPSLTTFFSPSDAFDRELPWTSITLTRSELGGLVREAPAELRAMFASGQDAGDIEAISLEYNNVVVVRPWFKSEFFRSRCWKLPEGVQVSTGEVPCRGVLPAYISSMLVARNVRITRRASAPAGALVLPLLSSGPVHAFNPANLAKMNLLRAGGAPVALARPPSATVAHRLGVFARPRIVGVAAPAGRAPVAAAGSPARTTFVRVSAPIARPGSGAPAPANPAHPALAVAGTGGKSYSALKQRGLTIRTVGSARPIIRARSEGDRRVAPPGGQTTTESVAFDGVAVLAFVCKRVPKSPDPDPGLQW